MSTARQRKATAPKPSLRLQVAAVLLSGQAFPWRMEKKDRVDQQHAVNNAWSMAGLLLKKDQRKRAK